MNFMTIGGPLIVLALIAVFGWPSFKGTSNGDFLEAEKYTGFETSVRRHSNGVYEVSVLTRMPDVEPEMVRWWFGDYLTTTEQYMTWHPTDHVWYDWENKSPGEHIGASGLVHEYIGGELAKLRIQFVPPEEILGKNNNLGADDVAICARPGLLEQPYYAGEMCHIVRRTDYGSEMRSRFWLGRVAKRKGNDRTRSIEGVIGNTYLARKLGIRKSDAVALMRHCVEEMGYLADLLPELYASETGQTNTTPTIEDHGQ